MPVHFQAWTAALTPYGLEFPEPRFYQLAGKPTEKIVQQLADEQGIEVDPVRVATEKEEQFFQRMEGLQPQAAVLEVARNFRGHLPMAVASGGHRGGIERQLATIGCADWFQAIVTAEDTDRHKPEPDVFLEAARRLGVSPAVCLVYEDGELGIEAARRAGMAVIDVRKQP